METKVALYVRYSSDDNQDKDATSSIENQIKLLKDYAKKNNFSIFDVYIDKGYTGTNFKRPAFKKLIEDMYLQKFSVILIKDRSRLSRDYIAIHKYDEDIFPKNNIRLIAVEDNYDSFNKDDSKIITNQLKDVLNSMYSQDIKRKIRKHYKEKAEKSKIMKIAKYGFIKENGTLKIDHEAEKIVKRIYKEVNEGKKPTEIARGLKNDKVYTPSFYKAFVLKIKINKNIYSVLDKPYDWNARMITNIISDYEYCGHTVNIINKNAVNEHKNILIKNTHPSIISEEEFKHTPKTFSTCKERTNFVLKHFFYCKTCNRALNFAERRSIENVYYCPKCHFKISVNPLEGLVYANLINLISSNKEKMIQIIKSLKNNDKNENDENLKKIKEIDYKAKMLFLDYSSGKIDETTLNIKLNELSKEKSKINNVAIENEQEYSVNEAVEKFKVFLNDIQNSTLPKYDLIKTFVEKCEVEFLGDTVEVKIYYKYKK